jgi:hypothetical protein
LFMFYILGGKSGLKWGMEAEQALPEP